MNLHQLRIFCAIAQSATLTQATELGLAQPALSQPLSKLEQKIGAKLFRRLMTRSEMAPAEVLDLLDTRQVNIGLVAANSWS